MKLTNYDREAIVRAIMLDVPKIDKEKRGVAIQAAIVKAMSPECRKLYNKAPDALRTHFVGDLISEYGRREVVRGDVLDSTVKEILAPYHAEDRALYETRIKLAAAIKACTTLKGLQTRLPEFKKYFPNQDPKSTNLPAIANVVADLSKLGWPKGSK